MQSQPFTYDEGHNFDELKEIVFDYCKTEDNSPLAVISAEYEESNDSARIDEGEDSLILSINWDEEEANHENVLILPEMKEEDQVLFFEPEKLSFDMDTDSREEILPKSQPTKLQVNLNDTNTNPVECQERKEDLCIVKKLDKKSVSKKKKLSITSDTTHENEGTSSESSHEEEEEKETLVSQIKRGLKGDFETLTSKRINQSGLKKRGRPEEEKDTSISVLRMKYSAWQELLVTKAKKNQRSDAKTASIARHIKKMSDYFLKHIGSKCQYKSKDLSAVVRSYLKSFMTGFVKFFKLQKYSDLFTLFLDFIVLCFPESKVTEIVKELKNQNCLSEGESIHLLSQLTIRKSASKASFTNLYDANTWFKIICEHIQNDLPAMDKTLQNKTRKIIKSLTK